MVDTSYNIITEFEGDISSFNTMLPKSLTGAQGFISTKSYILLELTLWSLKKLKEILTKHQYNATNLLSIMTLSV